MINNKNQFKNKLKENKDNIIIKREYNLEELNKIPVGTVGTIEKVQSNAVLISFENGCRPWMYFDNVDIIDNKIIYYNYIDDFDKEKAEEKKRLLESKGVEVIEITPDDKINKNNCANYKYIYKYIYIINEIIEKC